MKAKILKGTKDSPEILLIQCPGCNTEHQIHLIGPKALQWNGSLERPTLWPSLNLDNGGNPPVKCHSLINNGRISFLGDSTHPLNRKLDIELPEYSN